jgi:hypothetical protein
MNHIIKTLEDKALDAAILAAESYPRELRLFLVRCAREVQHLMKDQRSLDALDVAEKYAHGQATDEELRIAGDAANVAAWAAEGAEWKSLWAAAKASDGTAALHAVHAASVAAAWAKRDAVLAATKSYQAAAEVSVSWEAVHERQEEIFRDIFKDIRE